jgi:H+-transporting ATPase
MNERGTAIDRAEHQSTDELCGELGSDLGGLSSREARVRLERYGPNVLPEHRVSPLLRFLSYFWGPIAWMIEVAAGLSAILGHWADLAIIVILLIFNAGVGFWQERQASNAIEALKKQLALRARVRRDGGWSEVDAADLVPGDLVRLRGGDIVPADVKLVSGDYLSLDQSALTGESLPVDKESGGVAYSGSVAKQGEMEALVVATGADSYFGATAGLVEEAHSESHFQKAVIRIGDYLIYVSLALAAVLVAVGLLRGNSALSLVQFTLILIIASIPVAMPAVLSVTMAIGAVALARVKAIVARLASIEEMAGIDVLYSDKTGTLTQNRLTLGDPCVIGASDEHDLILAAALASKAANRDAIDDAIIAGLDDADEVSCAEQTKFVPFDPVSKRTEAEIRDQDGETFTVSKGAPQVILALCGLRDDEAEQVRSRVDALAHDGFRTLGVARKRAGDRWRFLGLLPLFDPPREDAAETIAHAREHGVAIKMVTGDNAAIAREIAGRLGLGEDIHTAEEYFADADASHMTDEMALRLAAADGFAQVFPAHKFAIVKALQGLGHIVGMTGDGVNDAPALRQADVGVAVSGATDAARAAAALVLTAPGLSVIVRAIEEARRVFERMNSYAIYRITETIRIMVFVVLTMVLFNFYPITAIMIILLALLNDLPIITIAYDNTWLDPRPVRWQMPRVLSVATVLGLVGVVETFGLLLIVKYGFKLDIAQIQSLIYLKLAIAGHLTLLVARTKKPFLTKPWPAPVLLLAVVGTKVAAILIVSLGLLVAPLPWTYIVGTTAYCVAWVFVEDWAKLTAYRVLDHRAQRQVEVTGRRTDVAGHQPVI